MSRFPPQHLCVSCQGLLLVLLFWQKNGAPRCIVVCCCFFPKRRTRKCASVSPLLEMYFPLNYEVKVDLSFLGTPLVGWCCKTPTFVFYFSFFLGAFPSFQDTPVYGNKLQLPTAEVSSTMASERPGIASLSRPPPAERWRGQVPS